MDSVTGNIEYWVINLDSRPDRLAQFRRQERRQLLPVVRRYEAMRGADARKLVDIHEQLTPGEAGLIGSFVDLITRRHQCGVRWLIVFEDDALLAPWFAPVARRAIESADRADAVAVQLGWISRLRWLPEHSVLVNVAVRTIRPIKRMRDLRTWATDPEVRRLRRTGWRLGTHALAVDASRTDELLQVLAPFDAPLDTLFIRAAANRPELFARPRLSLATQRFSSSDIGG